MVITVIMLMLLGMVEFGFLFDHHLTLEYATREGARVGAALANGGGPITPGCATELAASAKVDQQIVAAVQRVITSPGSAVVPSRVAEIRTTSPTRLAARSQAPARTSTPTNQA